MIAKTKIGSFKATWVLRHRWEKDAKSILKNYDANQIRKNIQLGVWVKRDKVVGRVKHKSNKEQTIKHTFNGDNLVNSYMVGLDLIVCKVWVDFCFRRTFGN